MPRPLHEAPPSSAVARLLDVDAASRAVSQAAVMAPEATTAVAAPRVLHRTQSHEPVAISLVKREFVLTPATESALMGLIDSIRRTTGARVNASHMLRSLLIAVDHARDYIENEARCAGPLSLPSNAREREGARRRFELKVAAIIAAGLRAAARLPAND